MNRLFKRAVDLKVTGLKKASAAFEGHGGWLSFGINIFLGVMTRMQPSNIRGLIWGRWQAQECRGAVETAATLIGLVEFHTVELCGVGTSGCGLLCLLGELHRYTQKQSYRSGF